MEPTDEELVSQSQQGSIEAFECLVRRYQPRIQGFLENQIGSREDAKDMTQQTFIKAYSGLGRFHRGSCFSPWIFTIARRQGVDFLRSQGAMKNDVGRYSVMDVAEAGDPSEQLSSAEDLRQIWNWVKTLVDQRSYQALWLRIQEEMSVKDISQVMGLSRAHVKVLLHRARKVLVTARDRKEGKES